MSNIITLGSCFYDLDTVDFFTLDVSERCINGGDVEILLHTHKKNQVLLMLQFCLKVNPLDYHFTLQQYCLFP